jgi:exopolyphosphatase/guanosine-5'-triphosphate,3'-diphosphate pyrophosphatase
VVVGVVDVGSNTIRLLVARRGAGVERVLERKAAIGLGVDVEASGAISREKLAEAAACVDSFVREARSLECRRLEVVVASPGRQAANAGVLLRTLARAARAPARILSQEEEACLAFDGALATSGLRSGSVAVCDVGGGSTQLVVGTVEAGPAWWRSADVGSLRLATRCLAGDPPRKKEVEAARAEARRELGGLTPPLPQSALAVGGAARALRRLDGRMLGEAELRAALRTLRRRDAATLAGELGVELWRARTLAAGTVILAEVQRRLGVPLEVARGGLREGIALSLLAEAPAA